MANFDVSATAVPVLDTWGWGDYWGTEDWINWHKNLVKKYGKESANTTFLNWWNKQTADMNPYNWSKYDAHFREYFTQMGILQYLSNFLADVVSGTSEVVTNVTSGVVGASGGVEDIGKGIGGLGSGIGSTLDLGKWILPIAAIIIVIVLLMVFVKKNK